MNKKTIRKQGKDLKIGDVLKTWDGDRKITHFSESPYIAQIADPRMAYVVWSGEWGMAVLDDYEYEVYDPEAK